MTMLNRRTLHAVSLFAGKEEARPYLNGVSVTCTADKTVYAASDALRFAAVSELSAEDTPNTVLGSWIVPIEICRAFKPAKRASLQQDLESLAQLDATTLRLGAKAFTTIDGTFPDWQRMMPRELSGVLEERWKPESKLEAVFFNPTHLADFKKFGEMMVGGVMSVAFNGPAPAGIIFSALPRALCVLVPIRVSTQEDLKPLWAERIGAVMGHPAAPKED